MESTPTPDMVLTAMSTAPEVIFTIESGEPCYGSWDRLCLVQYGGKETDTPLKLTDFGGGTAVFSRAPGEDESSIRMVS